MCYGFFSVFLDLPQIFLRIFPNRMSSVKTINSPQNPKFKRWKSLLDTQGIKAHDQCLVAGEKIIRGLIRDQTTSIRDIITPPGYVPNISDWPRTARTYQLSKALFGALDIFGTHQPLLVSDIPDMASADLTRPPVGMEVLCPMGDPGNLGAIIRSCVALGIQKIIVLQEAVHPFHPKVIRSSSGSVFAQPISQGGSLAALRVPDMTRWITALDLTGERLTDWKWSPNVRLLIGEEGVGIPHYEFSQRLRIPQGNPSIPLNAAVAGGIALYSYRQQFPHP